MIGQLALGLGKLGLSLLNVGEALLLGLGELVLKFKHNSGRATNFESLEFYNVSEPEHELLVIVSLLFGLDLLVDLDLLVLTGHGSLVGIELALLLGDLLFDFTFPVN